MDVPPRYLCANLTALTAISIDRSHRQSRVEKNADENRTDQSDQLPDSCGAAVVCADGALMPLKAGKRGKGVELAIARCTEVW